MLDILSPLTSCGFILIRNEMYISVVSIQNIDIDIFLEVLHIPNCPSICIQKPTWRRKAGELCPNTHTHQYYIFRINLWFLKGEKREHFEKYCRPTFDIECCTWLWNHYIVLYNERSESHIHTESSL